MFPELTALIRECDEAISGMSRARGMEPADLAAKVRLARYHEEHRAERLAAMRKYHQDHREDLIRKMKEKRRSKA